MFYVKEIFRYILKYYLYVSFDMELLCFILKSEKGWVY